MNKLLRLRDIAQKFVERHDGREIWKISGGRYKAADVWKEIRPKREKIAWHRLLWDSFVVPKHAVIAWMAILNRLPTIDRLQSWGIEARDCCALCKQDQKTRDHLFFGCPFSKAIWQKVLSLCGLKREVMEWKNELSWDAQKIKGKSLISLILRI